MLYYILDFLYYFYLWKILNFSLLNLGIGSNLNSIEYIRLFFNGDILYLELMFEYFRI